MLSQLTKVGILLVGAAGFIAAEATAQAGVSWTTVSSTPGACTFAQRLAAVDAGDRAETQTVSTCIPPSGFVSTKNVIYLQGDGETSWYDGGATLAPCGWNEVTLSYDGGADFYDATAITQIRNAINSYYGDRGYGAASCGGVAQNHMQMQNVAITDIANDIPPVYPATVTTSCLLQEPELIGGGGGGGHRAL